MKRLVVAWFVIGVVSIGVALAQSMPTSPLIENTQDAACSAPSLPGFVPYIVRPGDQLAILLTGVDNVTITQVAAVNCLDDSAALPVGATIWLPDFALDLEVASPVEDTSPDVEHVLITSVMKDADVVANQTGINLTWAAEGAYAYLYPCPPDPEVDCSRPFNATPVPLAHTVNLHGFHYPGPIRYRFEVVDGDARDYRDIVFRVVCSQESLAPASGFQLCPKDQASPVFGAWQPFQGGVMIWFADTRQIYVLFNEGQRVQVFDDPYIASQPEPTRTPSDDRVVPVRGFGLVWRELGGEDGVLGPAMAEEIGFDSARQVAGRQSLTTYIQGPGATVYAVTLVPETDGGYWTQVAG